MIPICGLRAPVAVTLNPEHRRSFTADQRSRWTPDKDRLLEELWTTGQTGSEIADALGRGITRNAVIARANRIGLRRRASPLLLPGARHG